MIPSPCYPYERVQRFVQLQGAEEIPRQLCQYLLDLPLPGYQPPDSNEYPRARLMKYLYYDEENPLEQPLPTPEQKLALVYDPLRQTDPPDRQKRYRVFPQGYVSQTEYQGRTALRCWMGTTIPRTAHRCELSAVFEILTNNAYEGAAGTALARTFAMECALIQALNGVNINGTGTFYFDRQQHPACGSWPIDDRGSNVGRRVVLGVSWGAE